MEATGKTPPYKTNISKNWLTFLKSSASASIYGKSQTDIRMKNLFGKVEDPRVDRTKKHPLEGVLYIVLCGTIAGVDSWIDYQDYSEEHFEIVKNS